MAKGRRSKLRKIERDAKEAPKAYPDQVDKARRPKQSPERDGSETVRPDADQNP